MAAEPHPALELPADREPERVWIPLAGGEAVPGELIAPRGAPGAVVVAAPDGRVAGALGRAGFATLWLELPPGAAAVRALAVAVGWMRTICAADQPPLGVYGAAEAAVPALIVAAGDDGVRAVVASGPSAELAGVDLGGLRAPALLVVGGGDPALRLTLGGAGEVAVVGGDADGADIPAAVARLATEWFGRHLRR